MNVSLDTLEERDGWLYIRCIDTDYREPTLLVHWYAIGLSVREYRRLWSDRKKMENCKHCGCLLLTQEERESGVCGACLPLKKLLCVRHVRVNADDLSDLRFAGVQLTRHPVHENVFRAIFPENTVRQDDGTYILPGNTGVIVENDELSIVWRSW